MLSSEDSGHDVTLAMHQEVDITLGTVGPGAYGTPDLSSPAVRFEDVTDPDPPTPGGARQLYRFTAVAQGNAVLSIPFDGGIDPRAPFTLTFHCCAQ
jgi:hypothetical protein